VRSAVALRGREQHALLTRPSRRCMSLRGRFGLVEAAGIEPGDDEPKPPEDKGSSS
jgi:hypothetical protein